MDMNIRLLPVMMGLLSGSILQTVSCISESLLHDLPLYYYFIFNIRLGVLRKFQFLLLMTT